MNKRKYNFWNDEMSLTSERARYIISNTTESKKLAKVIRNIRYGRNKDSYKFIIEDRNVIINLKKMNK